MKVIIFNIIIQILVTCICCAQNTLEVGMAREDIIKRYASCIYKENGKDTVTLHMPFWGYKASILVAFRQDRVENIGVAFLFNRVEGQEILECFSAARKQIQKISTKNQQSSAIINGIRLLGDGNGKSNDKKTNLIEYYAYNDGVFYSLKLYAESFEKLVNNGYVELVIGKHKNYEPIRD